MRPDPLLTPARSRNGRQVCKFSDTQSSAMQKGIKFAKEVLEAYGCQVVVVLTYSNTKSLGHLASCEEEFQTLKSLVR